MVLHFQVAYSGITVGDEICDLLVPWRQGSGGPGPLGLANWKNPGLPSGNSLLWTMAIEIVDIPIKHGDFP